MEITLKNRRYSFSEKKIFANVIPYIFIVLFVYTASSKIITYDSFTSILAKMVRKAPIFIELNNMIYKLNYFIAISIITSELIVSLLLIIKPKLGLWFSILLLVMFTSYLIYMVSLNIQLPCTCGGVISRMTWPQHIWFNVFFMMLAIYSLLNIRNGKAKPS